MTIKAGKPYGIIYLAWNHESVKGYVGQTIRSLRKRWTEHLSADSSLYLANAIKKYGDEKFELYVLKQCESEEVLNLCEQEMILFHGTMSPGGYNLTTGGGNFVASDVAKMRMSEAAKNRNKIMYKTGNTCTICNKGKLTTVITKKVFEYHNQPCTIDKYVVYECPVCEDGIVSKKSLEEIELVCDGVDWALQERRHNDFERP